MHPLKRDLLDLFLGIGVLALGLTVLIFTFSQAYALAQNPGEFLRGQLPSQAGGQAPSAAFSWQSNDASVTFTDRSTPGDTSIVAWTWNFGDGGGASTANPMHTYGSVSAYNVTLIVRDGNGMESRAYAVVGLESGGTRSGESMRDPTAGLEINLDFSGIIMPFAVAFLTFGMYVVMAVAGGMVTKAGWNLVKPKPETVRVRLKPKHLTQALEEDSAAAAAVAPPPPQPGPLAPPAPPPPPQG